MNVLFIANSLSEYGANLSMIDLIQELNQKGVISYVLLPDNGPVEHLLRKYEIKYAILPYQYCAHVLGGYTSKQKKDALFRNLFLISQTQKYIENWKIDVIHSNASNVDFGAMIALRFRLPHVWHVREMLYKDYQLVYDYSILTQLLMKLSSDVICISDFIKRERKLEAKNVCVIQDGLDLDKYNLSKNGRFIDNNIIELLFAANMNESKGALDAVKAVDILVNKYHSSVHLILAGGDSSYLRQIMRYVKRRNLEKSVEWIGFQKDLTVYREAADIALVCSRSEGLGRVTIEGMLGELLVIGANAGATTELINNGENGYLYDVGDAYELARKIYDASYSINKSKQIIRLAKAQALEKYRADLYADKIVDIYNKACKKLCYRKRI